MSGRLAWITGASSGLGRALSRQLIKDGWRVAASARRDRELETLSEETGGRAMAFPLDITDRHAVERAVENIVERCGPIDLAVLNAGTYFPDGSDDFSAEGLARTVGLNLIGAGNCLDPLLRHYRARNCGHVALVASLSGYRGLPRAASYGASKAGLINLAESLRTQAPALGIKVQLINPGFVRTPLTDKNDHPMPFLISAEQAALAICQGLHSNQFEIAFPWRFAAILKLARLLPDRPYFALVHKVTGL